jgi:hypothetical protein
LLCQFDNHREDNGWSSLPFLVTLSFAACRYYVAAQREDSAMSLNRAGTKRVLRSVIVLAAIAAAACSDSDGSVAVMNPVDSAGTSAPTAGTAPIAVSGSGGSVATAGSSSAGRAGSAAAGTSAAVATAGTGAAGSGAGAAGAAGGSSVAGSTAGAAATAGSGAAGTAAAAGAGGAVAAGSGAAGQAGGASEMHMDLGKGDGTDVITIGDSWMNYAVNGGGIEAGLRTASGQRYRNYGVAGTMLLDEVIPNQYESAKRSNKNIKTVVMTGGGNDLLLTGMTGGSTCSAGCMDTINKVGARLKKLWDEMGVDGVQDIVYIEYSRGGSNAPGVNYGTEQIKPICAALTPARCHFVDSDPIIMMQLIDGVHPTADGCQKIGKAVYTLMESEGMRR